MPFPSLTLHKLTRSHQPRWLRQLGAILRSWFRPAAPKPTAPEVQPRPQVSEFIAAPTTTPVPPAARPSPFTLPTSRVLHRAESRPPETSSPASPEAQSRLIEELRARHGGTFRDAWDHARRSRPELFPVH